MMRFLQHSSPSVIATGAKSHEEKDKINKVWYTLLQKLFAKRRNLRCERAKHQTRLSFGILDASIPLRLITTSPNRLNMKSVKNAPVGMTRLDVLESYQIHKGGEH